MIEIYGTPTCGFCRRAKLLAERYKLEYEYKDITESEWDNELNERYDGEVKTVPQIYWNNKYIGGYNELVNEIENTRFFGQDSF